MKSKDILMAIIGSPHGIKGEVRVKSFTEDPLAFAEYGELHDATGNAYQVSQARFSKTVAITRFKGIDTREKAEALNGVELFVDRSMLPQTDDEDEFYMSDLVGLEAVSDTGVRLGIVKQVHDFGAGDILEIRLENGPLEMFPFTREIFPQVDVAGGKLVFVPPMVVSERDEGEVS
jgi:16S rRNA processing protein RimM